MVDLEAELGLLLATYNQQNYNEANTKEYKIDIKCDRMVLKKTNITQIIPLIVLLPLVSLAA